MKLWPNVCMLCHIYFPCVPLLRLSACSIELGTSTVSPFAAPLGGELGQSLAVGVGYWCKIPVLCLSMSLFEEATLFLIRGICCQEAANLCVGDFAGSYWMYLWKLCFATRHRLSWLWSSRSVFLCLGLFQLYLWLGPVVEGFEWVWTPFDDIFCQLYLRQKEVASFKFGVWASVLCSLAESSSVCWGWAGFNVQHCWRPGGQLLI